jgi:putative flippase GtrA
VSPPVALRLPTFGRFAMVGALVALTYTGLTLLFSGPLAVPIAIAIAVAYVLAVTLHFVLQRTFVFAHVDRFGLTVGQQVKRYLVIGGSQYVVTAAAATLLPGPLGVPEQAVYLGTVAVFSTVGFLLLRHRVFHPHAGDRV